VKREVRALHKALKEIKATQFQRKATFILYQVNGYDSAMSFIRKVEQSHDTEPIPTTQENSKLRAA
jgi:hypothetical protein